MFRSITLACCAAAVVLPTVVLAAPIFFEVGGSDAASIQPTVEAFRAALGNPNNGNNPGPLAAGRREINWDGGGANFTTTAPVTPFNVFLDSRGGQFITPGTGLTQAPPSADPVLFPPGGLAGLNPTYATIFSTFSPERLFVPVGSNETQGLFFLPGTGGLVPATVSGFGAVFTDVDLANETSIQFFDAADNLLLSRSVAVGTVADGSLSFLGVQFNAGELISRVLITTGTTALGPNDDPVNGVDVVAMDDFLYAEPQQLQVVPEPSTLAMLAITGIALLRIHRSRQIAGAATRW